MSTQTPTPTQADSEAEPLVETNDRNVLHAAYLAFSERIAMVDRDDPLATGVDTLTAAKIIYGALPAIMKHREEAARLPDFDVKVFDDLEGAVQAALFTQYEYQSLSRPPEPIHELLEKSRLMLGRLRVAADALLDSRIFDSGFDGQLNGGVGHAQLAADLSVMARLFEREWTRARGKTAITEEEWQEALRLGDALLRAVATRDQQSNARAEMAELRQKAKVHVTLAYDAVRRAIEFLRWNKGDAAAIVPSLFAGRTLRKPKEDELVDTQPSGPPPIVIPVTPVPPITPAEPDATPNEDEPFTT
jgi:hypothetical protein